ncbi:hypothetical protein HDU96_000656 [Phlyctochytrium bullatum]|nr:hypothetical protein HDU96_000656 [Phlyctochytrium bullatum]
MVCDSAEYTDLLSWSTVSDPHDQPIPATASLGGLAIPPAPQRAEPIVYQLSPCCLAHCVPSQLTRAADAHRQHLSQHASPVRNPKVVARRSWPRGSYFVASRVALDGRNSASLERGQMYIYVKGGEDEEARIVASPAPLVNPAHYDELEDSDDEWSASASPCDLGSSVCSSTGSTDTYVLPSAAVLHRDAARTENEARTGLFHLRWVPCMAMIHVSSLPDDVDEFVVWMPPTDLPSLDRPRPTPAEISSSLTRYHWLPAPSPTPCSCHFRDHFSTVVHRDLLAASLKRKLRAALSPAPTTTVPRPIVRLWTQTVDTAVEAIVLAEVLGVPTVDVPTADNACETGVVPRPRADSGVADVEEAEEVKTVHVAPTSFGTWMEMQEYAQNVLWQIGQPTTS